jgi:hypothetical protein
MPNPHTDAEAKLQKLGQRLRAGWAAQHPADDRDLESVRAAVRAQWERDQELKGKDTPGGNGPKPRQPEPPEPEQDRS